MRYGKRKAKHTSLRMVSMTGEPAPSWTPAPELAVIANKCFQACLNPYAKPDLIRVFRNNSDRNNGRCFVSQRIVTINRELCDPSHALAHEIAHLRIRTHGKRHAELTERLYEWIKAN